MLFTRILHTLPGERKEKLYVASKCYTSHAFCERSWRWERLHTQQRDAFSCLLRHFSRLPNTKYRGHQIVSPAQPTQTINIWPVGKITLIIKRVTLLPSSFTSYLQSTHFSWSVPKQQYSVWLQLKAKGDVTSHFWSPCPPRSVLATGYCQYRLHQVLFSPFLCLFIFETDIIWNF